jgi:flagellar assembly protein FliH
MGAPAKFLFDQDFSGRGAETALSKASFDRAVAEAEVRGRRAGHASAVSEAENRGAQALERIGEGLAALASSLQVIEDRLETEAVEVAVAVARKLAPALIDREPFVELAALATDCFAHLTGAPHVAIRVNDAFYATAREQLEDIARARGFAGRLIVLADADIAPGDCRIEWSDGGVIRDRGKAEAAIAEAVERYLAVRHAGAHPSGGNDE